MTTDSGSGVLSSGVLSSGVLSSGMLSAGILSSGVLSSEVTRPPFYLFIENFIHSVVSFEETELRPFCL
jgi:hypothetical protein